VDELDGGPHDPVEDLAQVESAADRHHRVEQLVHTVADVDDRGDLLLQLREQLVEVQAWVKTLRRPVGTFGQDQPPIIGPAARLGSVPGQSRPSVSEPAAPGGSDRCSPPRRPSTRSMLSRNTSTGSGTWQWTGRAAYRASASAWSLTAVPWPITVTLHPSHLL